MSWSVVQDAHIAALHLRIGGLMRENERLREVLEEIRQHLEDGDDSGAFLIVRHELKKVVPDAT